MTAAAVQAPTPQADIQQAALQQTQTASQSFKDVMQAVQKQQAQQTQKNQQSQKPQANQGKTQVKDTQSAQGAQQTQNSQQASQTQEAQEGTVLQTQAGEIRILNTEDARGSQLQAMFTSMFGIGVAGIDYAQSDEDILKDLLNRCQDPGQQFAIMLMMAFLQENPDYTLQDLAGEMPPADGGQALTGTAAVATVMTAINKLMAKDDAIESFPLFDQARNLLKADSPFKNPFMEMMKELNVQSATVTQTSGTAQQGLEAGEDADPQAELFMQGKFANTVAQVKQALQNGSKDETADIEKLQQQVDSGMFLRGTNAFAAKAAAGSYLPSGTEFVDQVRTGLMANLESAKTEFVMQLKPEGLGELTVKLAEVAGKMTLSITASNVQTQRLLEAQLPNLREAMKPYDVEVSQTVNDKDDAAARFGGAFGEQFGGHQHQAMDQQHRDGGNVWLDNGEEEAESPIPAYEFTGTETINTYI